MIYFARERERAHNIDNITCYPVNVKLCIHVTLNNCNLASYVVHLREEG